MDYTNREFTLTPEEFEAWQDSYEWFINGRDNELVTDEYIAELFRDHIQFHEMIGVNGDVHDVFGHDQERMIKLAAEQGYISGGTASYEILQQDSHQIVFKILGY